MASKAFKRKEKVKELKSQRPVQKKKSNFLMYLIIIVVVAVAAYFIISALSAPRFIPTADDDPATGPADAKVTVIEFGCFTCPFTKQFNLNVLPVLMSKYDGQVNFVFRNMPIYSHIGAELSNIASECADEQGKFWEYGDMMFRGPGSFDSATLKGYAAALGLDTAQFNECLDSEKYLDEVKKDYKEGLKAGVSITPTLFINGFKVDGVHEVKIYSDIIDKMLSK